MRETFKNRKLAVALATGSAILATASFEAQASNITLSDLNDHLGLFGAAVFDAGANTLTLTPESFSPPAGATKFIAMAAPSDPAAGPSLVVKSDQLTGRFTAAPGFIITSIDVVEGGIVARLGATAQTLVDGSFVVIGKPSVGFAVSPSATNGSNALTAVGWDIGVTNPVHLVVGQSVADFSLNNVLAAAAGVVGDVALVWKTGATITVNVAPVPLPPALWMLGSAVLGLVTVRRNKTEA